MTDLSTNYLGLRLGSPLICSSSPLCEKLDRLLEMQEAGAGAVVLHSLFEEQISLESLDLDRFLWFGSGTYSEPSTYYPDMTRYNLGPEGYLEHLQRAARELSIPVIASLNGSTTSGWINFARRVEQAGARALELNIYELPTDPERSASDVERGYLQLVQELKREVKLPIAVKLSPYFTAPVHFARQLDEAGVDGLILFNRFYQPDFNLQTMELEPRARLSTSDELPLRLHWTALLFGRISADLAITGGIHTGTDVIKSLLAGARVAMMTSALLKHGIDYLKTVKDAVATWLAEREYHSVRQIQGCMSLRFVTDPSAFERAGYMQVIRSYLKRET